MKDKINLSFCVDCGTKLVNLTFYSKVCPKCLLVHENSSITSCIDSLELWYISKEEFLERIKEINPSRRDNSVI